MTGGWRGALIVALWPLALGPAAAHGDETLPPAQEAARQQRLAAARQALSQGEPDAALVPLEEAAGMSHAADTEMLQLQMQLQRGEFRQALAFAAHAAAAHRDEPATRELHLWLLALSGQTEHVRRRLEATDIALTGWLDGLDDARQPLPASLPAPWPHGVEVPLASRPVATAVLVNGGQQALVPREVLAHAGTGLWLRNGLGRASRAQASASCALPPGESFECVDVQPPLPPRRAGAGLQRSPRTAFAGSPVLRLAMLRTGSAAPGWPRLQMGFLGRAHLGWPAGAALGGGPVFDASGRLLGLARLGPDGLEQLVPAAALPPLAALPLREEAAALSPDQVYEAALPFVAQLLVTGR